MTKQQQLEHKLQAEILEGKYSAETPLPSGRALVRMYGVSRNTVRGAVASLARKGLITHERGRGTFATKLALNRTLGLILPGIGQYPDFYYPIFVEISRLARQFGYQLLTCEGYSANVEERQREVVDLASRLIRKRVAGIVFVPLDHVGSLASQNERVLSAFTRANIPVVLVDSDPCLPPKRSNFDLVAIDNVDAGMTVANHLFEAGAKDICFMRVPAISPNVLRREQGVMCAVVTRTGRWSADSVLVCEPDDLRAVRCFIRRRKMVDAFVCDCDTTAARLRKTLHKIGLSVPDDIMLAGFDDVKIASHVSPPLTTIHQPCDDIARTAFFRILSRIRRPDMPTAEIFLPAPLVVRASSVR